MNSESVLPSLRTFGFTLIGIIAVLAAASFASFSQGYIVWGFLTLMGAFSTLSIMFFAGAGRLGQEIDQMYCNNSYTARMPSFNATLR